MPKPTTTFTWATDATVTDAGNPAFGLNTKSAPSAGRQSSGMGASEVIPGDEYNYLFHWTGEWIGAVDTIVQADGELNFIDGNKTGDIRILPHSGIQGLYTAGGGVYETAWGGNTPSKVSAVQDEIFFYLDITDRLPDHGSFVSVETRIQPGRGSDAATYRLTGNRMEFSLWEIDHTADPPTETQLGSTQEDDGTGNRQSLIISGLGGGAGISIDKEGDKKSWVVRVRSSDDAVNAFDDFFYAKVSISWPGPRAL